MSQVNQIAHLMGPPLSFDWRSKVILRKYIAILLVVSSNMIANDLLDGIMLMMGTHPRIQAISKSHEASVERIKETHRKQFGLQLDFSMAEGYQRYKKPLLEFTEKEAKENTLKITKMLYDFGKSEALEEDARFTSNQR